MLTVFLISSGVAAAVLVGLLAFELRAIRRAQISLPLENGQLAEAVQRKINQGYLVLSFLVRQLAQRFCFYFLFFVHQLLLLFKRGLLKLERRFSRLVNAVRGRGVIQKKGAVSLFLLSLTSGEEKGQIKKK